MTKLIKFLIPAIVCAGIIATISISAIPVGDSATTVVPPNLQLLPQTPNIPQYQEPTPEPEPALPPVGVTPKPVDPQTCQHQYSARPALATCTRPGGTTYTCVLCSTSYVENYTPPHGHLYESRVIPNTCDSKGYVENICVHCKDSYRVGDTDIESHPWSAWTIQKYATPLTPGIHSRVCLRCDKVQVDEYVILPDDCTINFPEHELSLPFTQTQLTLEHMKQYGLIYSLEYGINNPFLVSSMDGDLQIIKHLPIGSYIYIVVEGIVKEYQILQHVLTDTSPFGCNVNVSNRPEDTLYIYLEGNSAMQWLTVATLQSTAPLMPITHLDVSITSHVDRVPV